MSITDFAKGLISAPDVLIRDAMQQMDSCGVGILLIAGADRRLLGVLTDGDIRRAILGGNGLDGPVREFMNPTPVSHTGAPTRARALNLMDTARNHLLNHLPVIDEKGRILDLLLRHSLGEEPPLAVNALIMAGGYGERLRPLTDDLPKPMLAVGGRPLMELIIERLRDAGLRRISIATHYRPEAITGHFEDGNRFGVKLTYIQEPKPLGTAGALGLLEPAEEPLLVVNGDVLTAVDYRAMMAFHGEQRADLTLAVRSHDFQVPYGVVQTKDLVVTGIAEKPVYSYLVIAGIYMLEPRVLRLITPGEPCDMPDLITRAIEAGQRVVSFPVHEYWLDIGRPEDYRRAQNDFERGEA